MEAVSVATGLVDTSLNLYERVSAWHEKHANLPQGVTSVRSDLRYIEEAIRKRSRTADRDGIRSWVDDLRRVKLRIEDAVEYYELKFLGGHTRNRRRIAERVADKCRRSLLGPDNKKLLGYLNEIKQLITDARNSVNNYQLSQLQHVEQTSGDDEEDYHHPKEADPVGLETATRDLVRMLSRDKNEASQRVVAISGRHGCGKSILAEAVYNKVKEKFECKAWSRATQNGKLLLRDILDQLGRPQPDSKTTPELSELLKNLLNGKRYIIGIDGLETEKYWNDVLYACPDGNTSSRIIVTTTNKGIASVCRKNCSLYMMQQDLDKTSAQDLLVRKVFSKDGCPKNLCEDLNIILETCEYNPLAIANIGDYMRGLNKGWDYAKCEELCTNFSSLLVNKEKESFRGMRHVLNRSYTNLNENAKACLLSLSSYPNDLVIKNHVIKNHVIKAKPLIRRLLAENLVLPTDDLSNECLTPLIEHSFIIPLEFSISGHVKTFRVNRMVSQFMKEKGDLENYVTRIHVQQDMELKWHSDITRLYLDNIDSSSESLEIRKRIDLTHVRLLIYRGKVNKDLMCFKDYKFLQVLVLENCENLGDDNLDNVCRLRMLKYLSIRGNRNLNEFPKNIGKMSLLETLDARDTMVHLLPMNVFLLQKLAHLFGEFEIICTNKDIDSTKYCQLQTLSGFFVDKSPLFIKLLPSMPKLSKVKILHSQAVQIGDGSQIEVALNDEVRKDLLQSLSRWFNSSPSQPRLHSLSFDFDGCDLNFVKDLEFPFYLFSLKLRGKLTILPEWITSHRATEQCNLTELCLSGSNIASLSELQCLEKLLYLKLTGDSDEFVQKYIWHDGWFKNLERLHLDFPVLPQIIVEKGAMQNLRFLQLSCTDLGGFDGIENLFRLEELILPSAATSAKAVHLLNQVKMLPTTPRVIRSGSGRRKLGDYKRFPKRPDQLLTT